MEPRPADFPTPRLPMGTFSDVPAHRDSVGAMAVTSGSREPDNFCENFKPYVYRGTGFDTLTAHMGEDWERGAWGTRPQPKRKPKRKRKKRKRMTHAQVRERIYETPRKYHWDDPRHARHWERPEPDDVDDTERIEPEPEPDPAPVRRVRSAPGWEPTTGADLDDLLEELSET